MSKAHKEDPSREASSGTTAPERFGADSPESEEKGKTSFGERASAATHMLKEKAQSLAASAKERVEHLVGERSPREVAAAGGAAVKQRVTSAFAAIQSFAKNHPVAFVATVLVVGTGLAVMTRYAFSRRRHHHEEAS